MNLGINSISVSGMTPIRWFSVMNPDMDFVVFVPDLVKDQAFQIIKTTMAEWWISGVDGYGDAVERALEKANIPFFALYPETEENKTQCTTVEAWDNWVDKLEYCSHAN